MDREQERQWTQRLMVAKMVESHAEARRIIREVRAAALEEARDAIAPTSQDGKPWRSGWVSTTAMNDVLRQKQNAITSLIAKEPQP